MYANHSTYSIAVWIANDGDFIRDAHRVASNDDQRGTQTERHIRGLLGNKDRTTDQSHTLAAVREGVALAEVDWSEIREELNSISL